MKQAPRLTEFEGGRLPSTDTKIQAQLRDKIKSVELGRKKERRCPVEGNKGGPCGLLSHWSTSQLMKQKYGEKGDTVRMFSSTSLALEGPGVSVFM